MKRSISTLLLGSLMAIALIGNVALAGKKKNKRIEKCRQAISRPVSANDFYDSAVEDIGPDEISDGTGERSSPGIDDVGDEFPSRDGGYNWDGGGAGSPWSDQF